MKKENFITLILSTVGGLLFALGMCMCLLPGWDAFTPGVVVTAIGAVVLIIMVIARFIMSGKSRAYQGFAAFSCGRSWCSAVRYYGL